VAASIAVDTSVAVPLLLVEHPQHAAVVAWARGRSIALTAHSLAETYSVLTRLRHGLRAEPADAARAIDSGFAQSLLPSSRSLRRLPYLLSELGISGGAVFDALVALAARDNGTVLATRDGRARQTYDRIGVSVEIIT